MTFKVGILTSKAGSTAVTLYRGLSRFLSPEIIEIGNLIEDFERRLDDLSIGVNYINSRQQITLGSIAESFIPLINDVSTFMKCKSKAYVNFLMKKRGIPVPRTYVISYPYTEEKIRKVIEKLNFPFVVKPNFGSCGKGSIMIRSEDDFRGVLDYISAIHEIPPTSEKIFLAQEFVRDAKDIRAFLIGDEIVAVEERVKTEGWKRNLFQGAEPRVFKMTETQEELVLKSAEILGIKYAGFDILIGEEDYLLEVNPAPGLKIAKLHPETFEKLAEFLKKEVKK
jgi:RimK family alpha-L-glutamate ligase